MANLDFSRARIGDLTNAVTDWEVTAKAIDSAGDQEETTWTQSKWQTYWGYFNSIPELKSAILMKAIWNVGKGYVADARTKVILDHVTGWGKDTFTDIIFNMECIKRIGGDAFAEIIRDEKTGILINLKPLDPSSMVIVVDSKGMIKRYEQISKFKGKANKKFNKEDIFHLSNNRLGDQIHGISDIDAIEEIIKADQESFTDIKKIMHRQARPLIMFKLGTDDQSKIALFTAKMDEATNKGENVYIPDDENIVKYEVVQVNVNNLVMEWRNELRNKFYRTIGLPQIVFGSAGTTESGGKIEYLAHEQIFEKDQKQIEEQIWAQLFLRINLIPPTSLLENLQMDEKKDNQNAITLQQNDVTAGAGK